MEIKIPFSNIFISIRRKVNYSTRIVTRDYDKVFVIGFNKTGTTSLKKTLSIFGFKIGNQAVAEVLSEDYAKGNTERIIRYCYTADAFQDLPFSKPNLYKKLDEAFPNSKFILTVRDDPDQWFRSLVKFHSKKFSSIKTNPPTANDQKNAIYLYKGFIHNVFRNYWNYPKTELYSPKHYKEVYVNHIEDVKNYFKTRPESLIVINVAKPKDFSRLCSFLNIETNMKGFPWENKTSE